METIGSDSEGTELDRLMSDIIALAENAGKMILGTVPVIAEFKGTKENYATETDIAIQEYLRRELLALIPGSTFMGEENDEYSRSDCVWIVDPIDGTVNYARGLKMSVVSIALVKEGRAIAGVVHNPFLNDTYHAYRGEGAYMNDERIHVSDIPHETGLVSTAWCAYDKDLAHDSFAISEILHRECSDIRRFGTAAYEMCLVARGAIEMYFEMLLRPWDYAAASLIVEEAGGVCSSINGDLDLFDQCPVLAANCKANLDYLKNTIKRVIGNRDSFGTIWK